MRGAGRPLLPGAHRFGGRRGGAAAPGGGADAARRGGRCASRDVKKKKGFGFGYHSGTPKAMMDP